MHTALYEYVQEKLASSIKDLQFANDTEDFKLQQRKAHLHCLKNVCSQVDSSINANRNRSTLCSKFGRDFFVDVCCITGALVLQERTRKLSVYQLHAGASLALLRAWKPIGNHHTLLCQNFVPPSSRSSSFFAFNGGHELTSFLCRRLFLWTWLLPLDRFPRLYALGALVESCQREIGFQRYDNFVLVLLREDASRSRLCLMFVVRWRHSTRRDPLRHLFQSLRCRYSFHTLEGRYHRRQSYVQRSCLLPSLP